jgi:hypothetical protein
MEGIVYRLYKRHYGAQGDALIMVVQADRKTLNPSLSQRVIDRAFEDDAVAAASEYGGAFRQPVTAFLPRLLVEKAVEPGVAERVVLPRVSYHAYVDVAGGTGADSFAGAIGHKHLDGGRDIAVVDVIFEQRPSFDPDVVTAGFSETLRSWGVSTVTGDAYAAAWPVTAFGRHGIAYVRAPLNTSEIYLHTVPLFTANRVRLPDHARLIDQLCALRRKVGSAGRETVSHVTGAHDDLATAVCGLLWRLSPVTRGAVIAGPLVFCFGGDGFDPLGGLTPAWSDGPTRCWGRIMDEERVRGR